MARSWIDDRNGSVHFGTTGVHMRKPIKGHVSNLPPPEERRPKSLLVGQFSRTSALNLRRKLACLPADLFSLFGLTLTMPSSAYRGAVDFKSLWADFCTDVSQRIRGKRGGGYTHDFGFIWRVELTTGENAQAVRTPHFHLIMWTHQQSDVLQLSADWISAVERHYSLPRGSLDLQVATQYTALTSCKAAFQYLAAHTCKHKKDQLGFPGRQWGIYYGTRENRRRMSPVLNRLDKKTLDEVPEISDDSREVMAHGNSRSIRSGMRGIMPVKIRIPNRCYYSFLRVVRRLVESQLLGVSSSSRSSYFRKKYQTRARRQYYARRFCRSSTLFFDSGTLLQLKAYWSMING